MLFVILESAFPYSPVVTVIMPSFNHRPYVQAAVDSVLNQTYPDVELVIVDNTSTDGTWEYVSSIRDPRVSAFSVRNDALIAASRNYGLAKARGEYVAFIDSDDAWRPEKLPERLPHLADASVSCVSTNFAPTGDVAYCQNRLSFGAGGFRDYDYEQIALANPVMTSSLVARKKDLVAAGGFDEDLDFRFIEDWEFWLRLSRQGRVRVLARPLLSYRVARKTGRGDFKLKSLKIFDKHSRLGYLDGRLRSRARGNILVDAGRACLEADDRRGIGLLWEGLVHCHGSFNRIRAIAALALFAVPAALRTRLIEGLYRIRGRLLSVLQTHAA